MEAAQQRQPKPARESKTVYISPEWHRRLRIMAAERGVRIGQLIEEALAGTFEVSRKKSERRN